MGTSGVAGAGEPLRFALFGPVQAWCAGERLDPGPARQRAVLAVLLLHANRPVGRERLIEAVWGDPAPAYAVNQLQKYVSALRRALEPGRRARSSSAVLNWSDGGYVLTVQPDGLDLAVFERRATRGRGALAQGDAALAAAELHEALGLWEGPALVNVSSVFLDAERDRLAELRTAVLEERIRADLDLGRHAELVPELSRLAADFPLREGFAALLMLALYRSGRQAEALAVYDEARNLLAEELGIDPGLELRRRHQQILTSDPALAFDDAGTASVSVTASAEASAESAAAEARRVPVPRQLPALPALFTGRGQELARLSAALPPHAGQGDMVAIAAVGGTGGVGKTCLALRWAHDHRDRFPDGELYANLRGYDPSGGPVPPAAALRGFLDALGVDPAAVPGDLDARIGLYRSLAEGKRMLVVLDNVRDTAQARPLIPGSGTCTVLITSRSQLAGLVTEYAATSLTMGVLPEAEAHELLTRRLGPDRTTAEPHAVAAISRRCGGLPLALSIVAARAAVRPHLPLAVLADELAESAERLDALDAGEVTADLRAAFATSYHALEAEAARAFALLGLAPGPDIGVPAAASLIGATVPRARTLLRTLEAAHLVRQHAPGRYQLHDLARLFAAECARREQDPTARTAAVRRLADFYLHTAHQAAKHLATPSHVLELVLEPPTVGCAPHRCADAAAAREWFETEDLCLLAAHQLVREEGWHTLTWQLAAVLFTFRALRGRGLDDMGTWQAALEAAEQSDDPTARAAARYVVGTACASTGRYAQAHAHLERALILFESTGNLPGQADALHMLGWSWGEQEAHQRALAHNSRALLLSRNTGDVRWEANCLNGVGWEHAMLGHYEQARGYCEEALAKSRTAGDRAHEAFTLGSLGYLAQHRGDHHRALGYYQASLTLFRETGNTRGAIETLQRLGETYFALRQFAAAREAWQQALDLHHAQHRAADAARLRKHIDALDMEGATSSTAAARLRG